MRDELYQSIVSTPVVDVHTHFETYTETFGYTMPQFLYNCCYGTCFELWMESSDTETLQDKTADPYLQFQILIKVMKPLIHTKAGVVLRKICDCIGVDFSAESYDSLQRWYQTRTKKTVQGVVPRIRATIANSPGHPLYGGIPGLKEFLNGSRRVDEGFYRSATITGFHCIHTREDLGALEDALGMPIRSLGEWERACRQAIHTLVQHDVVCFKELYLYFRSPEIHLPDRKLAEKSFQKVLSGDQADTALLDYLMFSVYEMVQETGLPVQVHTGGLLNTAVTASALESFFLLIHSFPSVAFDLLHLNYPMMDLYKTVLRSAPNVYGDATWIATMDEGYTREFLNFMLDNYPENRFLLFGSDRHCGGAPVAACLELTDQVLFDFFLEKTEKGRVSLSEAEHLASRWMYENPKALFLKNKTI